MSEDKCVVVINGLEKLMEKVLKDNSVCASSQQTREPSTT